MKLYYFALLCPILAQILDQNQVDKLRDNFKCTNFGIEFTVTKRQLYKDLAVPKSNKFHVGPRKNCDFYLRKRPMFSRRKFYILKASIIFDQKVLILTP